MIKVRNNNGRCMIRFKWSVSGRYLSKTYGDYHNTRNRHYMEGVAIEIEEAISRGVFSGHIDDYLRDGGNRPQLDLITQLERAKPNEGNTVHQTLINKLKAFGKPVETQKQAAKFARECLGSGSTFNRYLAVLTFLRPDLFNKVERQSTNKTEPDPFTLEERDSIFEWFRKTPYYGLIFALGITGMRTGELKGLEKEDFQVSASGQYLHVRRSYAKGVLKRIPKNKKSRKIYLSSALWHKLRKEFPKEGNPYRDMSISNVRARYWEPCLKELGIRYRKIYCLRHTFISLRLLETGDITDTARTAGTSIEMIDKHYAGRTQINPVGEGGK